MPDTAADVFSEYVKDEFDRQSARKSSFEQRGLSVITTSGVLVTLLFGLAGLSTQRHSALVLPQPSKVLLVVAIGFFFVAIAAALVTNVPLVYRNVTPDALNGAVNDLWGRETRSAQRTVARTRIDALRSARTINTVKAWVLFGAIAAEMIAVALLASAIGVVVSA